MSELRSSRIMFLDDGCWGLSGRSTPCVNGGTSSQSLWNPSHALVRLLLKCAKNVDIIAHVGFEQCD